MTLEQVIEIIERYKLRIPPTVYYELLADVRNEQEPQTFKWCTDCKEYNQEKHCCPRWSKVIRDTVAEMEQEYIEREVLDKLRAEITTLQNRCYALTKGNMCVFCKYECEYKPESEVEDDHGIFESTNIR